MVDVDTERGKTILGIENKTHRWNYDKERRAENIASDIEQTHCGKITLTMGK